jgi:hypothetical protein
VLFARGLWPLLHLHATSHHKSIRIHGGGCAGSGRVESGSDGTTARDRDGSGEVVEHTRVRVSSKNKRRRGGAFVRGLEGRVSRG